MSTGLETGDLIAIVTASGGASGVATWAAMKVKLDWLRKDVNELKDQVKHLWERLWHIQEKRAD